MDWTNFFKAFLRNAVITLLIMVVLLSLVGYLLAGKEGLVGGATWGLVLGLIGVPASAFMGLAKYWGDYSGRISQWWVQKETEGENNRTRKQGLDR